jgi:hypothetical protein
MIAPAHFCFVSDQPVPSLTPLIDPALAVRRVTLVHSPERTLHAAWLAAALARHHVESESLALADAYHLDGLRDTFAGIAARYPQGIALNLTGGSKLMTLAAWEIFDRPADRLYYIHIHHDRLDWLRPAGLASHDIADRIKLEPYLIAHGLTPETPKLARAAIPPSQYENLYNRAANIHRRTTPVRTPPEVGGGWLESLVFETLRRQVGADRRIHDVARQFRVRYGADNRLASEIDIAVLRDNTLHLVECKTGQSARGSNAVSAMFKLAELTELMGGLRGRAIFVGTEPLGPDICERARLLGIHLVDRSGLADLKASLAAALTPQH